MLYHLKDFKDYKVTPRHDAYYTAHIDEARTQLLNEGLKFDSVTGVVSTRHGWLSRPSGWTPNPEEYNMDNVWSDYFQRAICSRAARICNRLVAA